MRDAQTMRESETVYMMPASVSLLAQLLEPLHTTLRNSLWSESPDATLPPLSRTQVRRLFLGIRSFAVEVTWLLNTRIAPLVAQENSNLVQLKKNVDRLSDLLEAQMRRYETVLRSQDTSRESINDLLAEAYRHNLREVRDWMADLIGLAQNPEPYLKPGHTGKVTLILELTSCPAMEQLREALMPPKIRYKKEASPASPPSLMAQLGWLVLGLGFMQWLFGGNEDA